MNWHGFGMPRNDAVARPPHLMAVAVVSGVVTCSREGGHASHHSEGADCTAASALALCSGATTSPAGPHDTHHAASSLAASTTASTSVQPMFHQMGMMWTATDSATHVMPMTMATVFSTALITVPSITIQTRQTVMRDQTGEMPATSTTMMTVCLI